jgi:hypothetical protein
MRQLWTVLLGVHPVVGGDPDHEAGVEVLAEQLVEAAVEDVGQGTAGALLVLDVVGQGDVE